MASKRDYYDILGLARDATDDKIKQAFRSLAKQLHPDVNKSANAETQFKEVGEAYSVLSDPEKRAAYDRYGHEGLAGMPGMDFSGGFPFDDIFEQFFGGVGGMRRAGQRGPRRGADLRYDLTISFDESVHGTSREINITRATTCPRCKGSRGEPGTSPVRCNTCNGSGELRQVSQTFLGSMVNVSACHACNGRGEKISTPCNDCQGDGQVNLPRGLSVNIPAGVNDGTQIRLSGEGQDGGSGGPPGNLYVILEVQPHRYFRRQDDDILLELDINVTQAALGDHVTIPTIDDDEQLHIPPGTQPGDVFRLRGRGVPHVRRRAKGDEVVIINVAVPTDLSDEQIDLFTKLSQTFPNGAKPREYKQDHGFLERIRNAFGL